MNKQETLKSARAARVDEVEMYQINIDNYTLAIARIDSLNDADLQPFREQLCGLLASEKLEQKKARVMLDVIASQLEDN